MQDVAQEKVVELVEKLEGVAPHVWEVFVRQQYIEGVIGLAFALLAFSALGVCVWKGTRPIPEEDRWGSERRVWDKEAGWAVACAALAMMSCVALIVLFAESMPHLLNPEYYAIMDLIP